MGCDFEVCIFNREFKCMYDSTNIDHQGMCENSIVVRLEKDEMERKKEEQFQIFTKRFEGE